MANAPGILALGRLWIQERIESTRAIRTALGETIKAKGFTLLPMQSANKVLTGHARPSDTAMLKAYAESPWLHIKLLRQCSAFAGLGFKVFERDQKTGELDVLTEDHPLWALLRNPNPMLRGWDFRFISELYVRTQGEVYWHLKRDGLGTAKELWVYPKTWVQPRFNKDGRGVEVYEVRMPWESFGGAAKPELVLPQDMLWLRQIDPLEPYSKGLGDVLALATELDTYELASESDRRFFQNDATPAGALVVPGQPNAEEVARIRDDWQAKVGGVEKSGSIPILAGGMDYKQFRQGRKEMDFIEGQRFLRDVIIGGVHKHIVGISDDVTFASAKAADYTFAKWDFAPRIMWWQDNLNAMLSPQFDKRAYVQWDNPVPADEAFELEKSNKGLMNGAITRNEWRKTNGYDELPKDQGDVYILPLSLIEVPASEIGESRETAPAPDATSPTGEETDERKVIVPKVGDGKTVTSKQLRPDQIREVLGQLPEETKEFIKRLEGAYSEIYKGRWEDVKEELGVDLAFNVIDSKVRDYIRIGAYPRIVGATETMFSKIHEVLDEQVARGGTVSDMARAIGDTFDDFRGYRALRISRQESLHASNQAAFEGYQAAGVDRIEWLLAPDYDPGQDDGECEDLDGVIVVAGEDFPGTGTQFPPLHIQCRCTILPVIPEREAEAAANRAPDVPPEDRSGPLLNYDSYEPKPDSAMPITERTQAEIKDLIGQLAGEYNKLADAGLLTDGKSMAEAYRNWAQNDVFPFMEKMFDKKQTKPFLEGIVVNPKLDKRAFYAPWEVPGLPDIKFGQIHMGPKDMETAFRGIVTSSEISSGDVMFQIDTIFHEMGHAMMDGFNEVIYDLAKPIVEGLNQQLGNKITRTVMDAMGKTITEDAVGYLNAQGSVDAYRTVVGNMRTLFSEAGINLNDERNLVRALKATTQAPVRKLRFINMVESDMQEARIEIADSLFREFKTEMDKAKIGIGKWRNATETANRFSEQSDLIRDIMRAR